MSAPPVDECLIAMAFSAESLLRELRRRFSAR